MHISKTINVVQPIFFTVSLEANIPTLQISVPIINRYYQHPSFFIICPAKSFAYFANALSDYPNVQLVNEDDLISFASFKKLAQQIGDDLSLTPLSMERLGWYYQQALKLSFLLNLSQSNFRAVMWDADSIPLAQIKFFDDANNRSIVYGSRNEFNVPYFETIKNIFFMLPEKFYAATIQFFTCTSEERQRLIDRSQKAYPIQSTESKTIWISKLIIDSVLKTHGNFSGSFFSEQELVGLSNMLVAPTKAQIPLKHLRWGISGCLSASQMLLAKAFNFKHLTYENPSQILSKKQDWKSFVQLLISETRHFHR